MTDQETPYKFAGVHFCASYIGCKNDKLTNINNLKDAMDRAVIASHATILSKVDHIFGDVGQKDVGYTCAYVLSESHATIHTYPEVNSCFVDLFTCGTQCSHEPFDAILKEYLEPQSVSFQVLNRDAKTCVKT